MTRCPDECTDEYEDPDGAFEDEDDTGFNPHPEIWMIRCPNLHRDEKVRTTFNGVLFARLGGEAMSAGDVSPRQAYVGRLTEPQLTAYHQAHYLWNAHKTPAQILDFLDALDGVRNALDAKPHAETPAQPAQGENETGRAPSVPPVDDKPATAQVNLARRLLEIYIERGNPITAKALQAEAQIAHGGTLAEGKFDLQGHAGRA